MNEPITTADQLDALPVGSVLVDKEDDSWIVMGRGELGSTVAATAPAKNVLKKWGPLVLRWRPDEAATVLPTEAEVAEALTSGWFEGMDEFGKYGPQFDPLSAARAVLALFDSRQSKARALAIIGGSDGND